MSSQENPIQKLRRQHEDDNRMEAEAASDRDLMKKKACPMMFVGTCCL